jgi:hypothetical protein
LERSGAGREQVGHRQEKLYFSLSLAHLSAWLYVGET